MKDVAPANSLTSCHMKLTAVLFGEHDRPSLGFTYSEKCCKTNSLESTDAFLVRSHCRTILS